MIRAIRPVRIDGDTAYVALTRGMTAKVSLKDLEAVQPYNWIAQCCDGNFYAARRAKVNGKSMIVLLHRVLLNAKPGTFVDHKNGDRLDNRRSNLRLATPSQNAANRHLVWKSGRRLGTTLGVTHIPELNRTNPWWAYVNYKGKRHHLGYFPTEEEAAKVRRKAAVKLHGAFAGSV